MARIVLASASPRRRELLAEAGVQFEVVPADVDESLPPGIEAEAGAVLLARTKALAVGGRLGPRQGLVLAADTIVALGGRFLGKPADPQDARAMLRALSSSRHAVVTGVAVLRTSDGVLETGFERTWVTMREITPDEIEAYVRSGEWQGKAGGYAIQETADRFVTGLDGSFDNVVGFPSELFLVEWARLQDDVVRAGGSR